MDYSVLVINPGSTSTKIAVYKNEKKIFDKSLQHTAQELAPFACINDQFSFRKGVILKALHEKGIDISAFRVIMGRGGLLKPIPSGVYEVNELMLKHLNEGYSGDHASNLGGILAADIASSIAGCRALIADPVVVDELMDIARITGIPEIPKVPIFHALNQKAVSRCYASQCGKAYEDMNLVVAHIGGGISIGAHCRGKVIDVNNGLWGDGPFSPERSGSVSLLPFARMCFSGDYTFEDIRRLISGKGGVVAHLGTNSFRTVSRMVTEGDPKATLVFRAMAYGIAKAIGAAAVALAGKVDAIIFTGGIAYDQAFIDLIKERVAFIAPCFCYPGEDELQTLASLAFSVLKGETEVKQYV